MCRWKQNGGAWRSWISSSQFNQLFRTSYLFFLDGELWFFILFFYFYFWKKTFPALYFINLFCSTSLVFRPKYDALLLQCFVQQISQNVYDMFYILLQRVLKKRINTDLDHYSFSRSKYFHLLLAPIKDHSYLYKIDVTAVKSLLVQNRQQTHDWTLIGSSANRIGIQCEIQTALKILFRLWSVATPWVSILPHRLRITFFVALELQTKMRTLLRKNEAVFYQLLILNFSSRATREYKRVNEVKQKGKALRHFKVQAV